MRKASKKDISFVLQNFNDDGWLFDPSDEQRDRVQQIVNTGFVQYRYHLGWNKWGYQAVGWLAGYVQSRALSQLLGTLIVVCGV